MTPLQKGKSIVLVIDYLKVGGAQKVIINLANFFAEDGWQVTLITFGSDLNQRPFLPLDPAVQRVVVPEPAQRSRFSLSLDFYRRIRQAITKARPIAVISFLYRVNIAVMFATRFMSLPIIISERNNTQNLSISLKLRVIMHCLYPCAARIVFQTEGLRQAYLRDFRLQAQRCAVIPNAAPPIQHYPPCAAETQTVISVGRLCRQKGYDLLLHAFALATAKQDNWRLLIVGDGPERSALEALSKKLRLGDRVNFVGEDRQPMRRLQQADIFVLSSRYEGFPNTLLEAMSCGLAVIATDCEYGPGDIVQDGVNGLLVAPDNVEALAAGLTRLMGDADLRKRLSAAAPEISERLSSKHVHASWRDLVLETLT